MSQSKLLLIFRPIAEMPDGICEAVLRGGFIDSGYKQRSYGLMEAWRDEAGRWWVGRGMEVEIVGPTEWAPAPQPLMTKETADLLRTTARANGMTNPSDFECLEQYIAQNDEDAAIGLIWAIAEGEI